MAASRIGQMLQDADAQHRVGRPGRQGERAQVARDGMQVHVHLAGQFAGVARAMLLHVHRHHRQPRRRQGQRDVDLAVAAAHVHQSLAGVAPQVAADPMRPARRPPAIAQVLEGVGGQGVDVTGHGDYRSGWRMSNSGMRREPLPGGSCRARAPGNVPHHQGTSLAMAVTDMIASRRSRRGFSIIELLVVLAVGAALMAVGTPVLRGAMANQRLRAGAADLGNALSEARREAFRTSTDGARRGRPCRRPHLRVRVRQRRQRRGRTQTLLPAHRRAVQQRRRPSPPSPSTPSDGPRPCR